MTRKASIGDKAPRFTVEDEEGNKHALPGKGITVLYFYPKDDTPGCTKQACSFKEAHQELIKENVSVFGINADGKESHTKFKQKYDLPFTLLCDEDKEVAKSYGVTEQKEMYGNKYLGINRTTFIIKDQTIQHVLTDIDVESHAETILKRVREL